MSERAPMTQEHLHEILMGLDDKADLDGNVVQFEYYDGPMICISDPGHDRMRIISPIARVQDLEGEQLMACLAANFHTALDARYALSGEILYSAFIHPLSPLTDDQVQSAVRQVAMARNTFGSTYSSGDLVFPGE